MKNPALGQDYIDLYELMLENVATHRFRRRQKPVSPFWPIVGKRFEKGKGVLVVGRATNGWGGGEVHLSELGEPSRRRAVLTRSVEWSTEEDSMGWVEAWEGNAGGYSTSRSAFWRTAKQICRPLLGFEPGERGWSEHIAYSNLAKLAPYERGNPPEALWRAQLLSCVELLRIEVQTLQPAVVLLMTGDWFVPFRDHLGVTAFLDNRSLVLGTFHNLGAIWCVAQHPQGKDENGLAKLAFEEISPQG